jgi:aromatic ring-cleaving dioxygenase
MFIQGNPMPERTREEITNYHAHVYYNETSREIAAKLRERAGALFSVVLGRWREEPIGPHPQSMYQIAFAPELFGEVVPWLMLNRQGLTILVHPETGDDLVDHRDHALWIGEKLPLRLEFLVK